MEMIDDDNDGLHDIVIDEESSEDDDGEEEREVVVVREWPVFLDDVVSKKLYFIVFICIW